MTIPSKPALLLLFFTILSHQTGLAQTHQVSGKVIHATTGASLPSVAVRLAGTPQGTLTNEQGHFQLSLPKDVRADQHVRISCVGFEPQDVPLSFFQRAHAEIKLSPKIVALDEVTIQHQKLKRRILGNDRKGLLAHFDFTTNDNGGCEVGTILSVRKNCYLETLSFYVEHNHFPFVQFKLNIYTVAHGLPDNSLLTQEVTFDVANYQMGWVKINLSEYHILLEDREKVAVTLQWLKSEKKATIKRPFFTLPATWPAPLHTVVYRDSNQSKWHTLKGNLSFYLTAQCY